jgi:hypothetical protein
MPFGMIVFGRSARAVASDVTSRLGPVLLPQ